MCWRALRSVGGRLSALTTVLVVGTALSTLARLRGRPHSGGAALSLGDAWTPRWPDARMPVPDATEPLVWLAAYDAVGADVVLLGQALAATAAATVTAADARCVWVLGGNDDNNDVPLYSAATEVRAEAAHCAIPDALAGECRNSSGDADADGRTCAGSRVTLEVTTANGTTTTVRSLAEVPVVPPRSVRAAAARRSLAERTAAFLSDNDDGLARPLRRRPRPHAVCAVTIVRNEAVYMDEYLDYHSRLGVSLFLVFDNNSTDATVARVRAWAPYGARVVPWPFRKSQAAAYVVGHLATRALCNFTLFMDMDQFISLGGGGGAHTDLAAVLQSAVDSPPAEAVAAAAAEPAAAAGATTQVGQVCLRSKMFHSSGLVQRPSGSVVSTYLRARPELELNPNCAVRPAGVRLESRVHWFVNADGWTRAVVPPETAVFNHYKEKSWTDYLRKYDGRIGLVKDWVRPANLSAAHPPPDWGAGPDLYDDSVVRFRDALYGCRQPAQGSRARTV